MPETSTIDKDVDTPADIRQGIVNILRTSKGVLPGKYSPKNVGVSFQERNGLGKLGFMTDDVVREVKEQLGAYPKIVVDRAEPKFDAAGRVQSVEVFYRYKDGSADQIAVEYTEFKKFRQV